MEFRGESDVSLGGCVGVKTGGSAKGEKGPGAVCLRGGTPLTSVPFGLRGCRRPHWFLRLYKEGQSGRDMDHW